MKSQTLENLSNEIEKENSRKVRRTLTTTTSTQHV